MLRTFINDYANCVSFGISLITCYALYSYYFYNDLTLISTTVSLVMFQCSYDIFLWHTNSSAIHHLFLLCLGSILYQQNIPIQSCLFLVIPLLYTEISTMFLVMKDWLAQFQLTNSVLFTINNTFFVLTFFTTRIYIFTTYIIYNPETYQFPLTSLMQSKTQLLYFIGIFGLYGLNLYWATIIIKILYKSVKEVIPEHTYFQQVIQNFSPVINAIICISCFEQTNLYVLGSVLFAVSATVFNHNLRMYPDSDHTLYYLMNLICFHLKSIFCVYTILGHLFGTLSLSFHLYYMALALIINPPFYMYDITGMSMLVLTISLWIYNVCIETPIISVYLLSLMVLLFAIKSSDVLVTITEREVLLIPVVIDNLMIVALCLQAEINNRVNFILLGTLLVLAIYLKPAYRQNIVLLYALSFGYECVVCNLPLNNN